MLSAWGQGTLGSVVLYRAEVLIEGTPGQVWAVLTDLSAYPRWNPFTKQVRSKLEVGSAVDMLVELNGRLWPRRETVSVVESERMLGWGMQLGPRWLLRAERRQVLESRDDRTTLYVTEDRIEGWLGPLVHLLFGATLQTGFAKMAVALKARVESAASSV